MIVEESKIEVRQEGFTVIPNVIRRRVMYLIFIASYPLDKGTSRPKPIFHVHGIVQDLLVQ